MTSLVRRVPALPVAILGAFVVALVLALAPSLAARAQDGADKSVFVSVVNGSGKPVADLKAESFAVSEDNVERQIKSVKPAAQPVFLEILADTSKAAGSTGEGTLGKAGGSNLIQDLRAAFNALVTDIYAANPANQVALMEFGQASITIVKFTSKPDDMTKGINKLFPKPSADSVLSEAIIQSANDLGKMTSPRRHIMILNIEPGIEASREDPTALNNSLKKSGASLWAVSLQQGQLAQNPMHDVVLLHLAQNTGGRREVINGQSAMIDNLKMFWNQINSQYEVVYTRPSATPNAVQVRVGVRADGLKIYNNLYAPK
jgi:hypothetical protein